MSRVWHLPGVIFPQESESDSFKALKPTCVPEITSSLFHNSLGMRRWGVWKGAGTWSSGAPALRRSSGAPELRGTK